MAITDNDSPRRTDESGRLPRPVVIWAGDLNLGRRQHYRTSEIGAENVLGGITALRTADLRIANLECVVAAMGEQGAKGNKNAPYYFRARPEMLRILTSAHIDIVATANNHSGDYGPEALLEQGRWLDSVGIGHTGSGANLEACLQPALRRAGDLNVAVFSLDATEHRFAATQDNPGIAHLAPDDPALWRETLAPRIAAIREKAHVVLVAAHWGRNHAETPAAGTKALARAVIDAGADAVLGSSAHIIQGAEIYRQRPILYDAGNLLFDSVRTTLVSGGVFAMEISPHGVERVRFVPIGIGFGYTVQLAGRDARQAVSHFQKLCSDLGTPVTQEKDQTGSISLAPPRRTFLPDPPPAPYTRFDLSPLERSIPMSLAHGEVALVPEYARISPVRLGPLTLLGLHVRPREITSRRMIWVESFWTSESSIHEDIRLNIRGVPISPTSMPVWGKSMDHDPCDWLAPTSRWRPGVIYRDFFGLRAPRMPKLRNVDLRIEVGILSQNHPDVPPHLGPILRMAIPDLKPSSSSTTSPSYRSEYPASIQQCLPGQTWTATQLQEVTGGKWLVPPPNGWHVRSVAYQRSLIRRLPKPFFFVAQDLAQRLRHAQSTRPKQEYDRHLELPKLARRLAGAMVSRPVPGLPKDFPLLLVPDPIQALMELGLAARQRYSGPLVAITGTAGKSTTVAMLRHMLTTISDRPGPEGPVLATQGNYNTRIDALAILANLHPEHDAAVVEVAQSALWMKRGPVTRLIRPTISVITEIGISQADLLVSSVADTAHWKSRIFDGLTGPAVAVIGDHFPYFDEIRYKAAQHAKQILIYGKSSDAQIRIREIGISTTGPPAQSRITLDTPQGQISFTLSLPSPGMVRNAAAALAVILAMGKDISAAAEALEGFTPSEGCLRYHTIILGNGPVNIIDDSYNATVTSMRNAFQVLAEHPKPEQGRKVAVLGRIVHLGEQAQTLHEDLAHPLLETGVELVITHGPEMRFLRSKLPPELLGPHCDVAEEAVRHLHDLARAGDVILIKGSRRESDFGNIAGMLEKGGAGRSRNSKAEISSLPLPSPAETKSRKQEGQDAPHPALSFTENLLLQAAARRNLKIIQHPAGYFEIFHNDRGVVFRRNSPDHSILASAIAADKHDTKELLAVDGFPVPEGAVFVSQKAARRFFLSFQNDPAGKTGQARPVCVKPAVSSKGRGVTPAVSSLEALTSAWKLARRYSRRVILEASVTGRNIRIMVLGGQAVGALECLPASITGNGRDTVAALIKKRGINRAANPWLGQWPAKRLDALELAGPALNVVPEPGASILLSNVAGITNGSDTIALADTIHVSLLELAEQIVRSFPGLHLGCVSLICDDPVRNVADQTVMVLDIDAKPAIADLACPTSGPAVDLSDALLDYASSLARQQPRLNQPPDIRPAPLFVPPPDAVFALDTRLAGQLLRQAARSRHMEAEQLSTRLTRITRNDDQILFYKTMSPGTRVVARRATNSSKEWTKQLLHAAGLPTPTWQAFSADQQGEAWNYLQALGVPAVIKPLSGSWGRGVTADVRQRKHFNQAWDLAIQTGTQSVMVEEYASGSLYRLFVIGNSLAAAAEILPARVTGDGVYTIQELVIAQNLQREQDPCLAHCPIVLGPSVLRQLHEQGLEEGSVLEAGRELRLDTVANIGVGGTSLDMTDHVHPHFASIAVQTRMAVFDPPHVGIDLIAQNISAPPYGQSWTIIEVNTNPDLDLHHFPASGHPRDVAGALVEFYFPTRETNDFSFRLQPSPIPNAGIGVFALHDIEPNTFLALKPRATPVGMTTRKEKIPEGLRMYCIEKKHGLLRCPRKFSQMHLVWFLNHSDSPNAVKRKDGYYSNTKIHTGEEILIDYSVL
ncbi:CapA family protein [Desulfonatronum parangueonense]